MTRPELVRAGVRFAALTLALGAAYWLVLGLLPAIVFHYLGVTP